MKKIFILTVLLVFAILFAKIFQDTEANAVDERYESFIANTNMMEIHFFLKDESGNYFHKFTKLKERLQARNKKLLFATNGGMFMTNYIPLGLYIENNKQIVPINKRRGNTNFYIKPNGIFYLTNDNQAFICESEKFVRSQKIKYATQSGPMLVIDDKINPKFNKNSINLNIRSGVGILSNGNVLFVISKIPVNFYDFADYFKRNKCSNALFLDGGISEIYYPEKFITDNVNDFGIIIAVTQNN